MISLKKIKLLMLSKAFQELNSSFVFALLILKLIAKLIVRFNKVGKPWFMFKSSRKIGMLIIEL
jgi:hypothetical protein